jgi:hypothetical protein
MVQTRQARHAAGHGGRFPDKLMRMAESAVINAPFMRMVLPLLGLAVFVVLVAALLVGLNRAAVSSRDAARRALLARAAALDRAVLSPGSALACLDAGAGETVENACEKMVFRSPQSVAAAVAYMDARLALLSEAAKLAKRGDRSVMNTLAATRRAVALDRFGIVAHVLATRDGCTADKCAAFALVDDAEVLKANLRAQVYDQYVSRHADNWNKAAPAPGPKAPAVSQTPAVPPVARLTPAHPGTMPAPIKPGEKWDFPSSASIPPVSIMGKEPPLPPGAKASAQAPPEKPRKTSPADAREPAHAAPAPAR